VSEVVISSNKATAFERRIRYPAIEASQAPRLTGSNSRSQVRSRDFILRSSRSKTPTKVGTLNACRDIAGFPGADKHNVVRGLRAKIRRGRNRIESIDGIEEGS
jgi:hypothetical protein